MITTGRKVSVIPATRPVTGQLKSAVRTLRVAAYCRVSTGDESQQTSFTTQKNYYRSLIQSRTGWEFAGIYADEALSGTDRTHRAQFNRMMEDARAGRLDYIVTKSISRFARNTVDTLTCVRELRGLSIGVWFEKENVDSLDTSGELLLTILSALSQDESRSISDNVKWGIQKRFQAGRPHGNPRMVTGYREGKDGAWEIDEAEAETVRRIFAEYDAGRGSSTIAEGLNRDGILTIRGNPWRARSVLFILGNEKYVGDMEMQKTVTRDFLTHVSTPNRGESPRYYMRDHHTAIVDRELWDRVQMRLGNRGRRDAEASGEKAGGVFCNLRCGICGKPLRPNSRTNRAWGYEDGRGIKASVERGEITPEEAGEMDERYEFIFPVWKCGSYSLSSGAALRDAAQSSTAQSSTAQSNTAQSNTGQPDIPTVDKKQNGDGRDVEKGDGRDADGRDAEKGDGRDADGAAQRGCGAPVIQQRGLEQSFMEMLYRLKRGYEELGDDSELMRLFRNAYGKAEEKYRNSTASAERLALLDSQIDAVRATLAEVVDRQVREARLREYAPVGMEESGSAYDSLAADLQARLDELKRERSVLSADQGVLTSMRDGLGRFIESLEGLPEVNKAGVKMRINGIDCQGSAWRDIDGKATGRHKPAHPANPANPANPTQANSANSINPTQASVGENPTQPRVGENPTQPRVGEKDSVGERGRERKEGRELIETAPDYLPFDKDIYRLFITGGVIKGDIVEYSTIFGVTLVSIGNSRTNGSFVGFRTASAIPTTSATAASATATPSTSATATATTTPTTATPSTEGKNSGCESGAVMTLLEAPWQVNGRGVLYKRREKKGKWVRFPK